MTDEQYKATRRQLLDILAALDRSHRLAAEPILRELVELENMRIPPIILPAMTEAEARKRWPKLFANGTFP